MDELIGILAGLSLYIPFSHPKYLSVKTAVPAITALFAVLWIRIWIRNFYLDPFPELFSASVFS